MNPIERLNTVNYGLLITYAITLLLVIVIIHFLDKLVCKIKFFRDNTATRIMFYFLIIIPLILGAFFGIAILIKSLF